MKQTFCLLLVVMLFLTGCGAETTAPIGTEPSNTQAVNTPEYLPQDLLGMTTAQLIDLYGTDYTEVVPEGDPPYFFFDEDSPYQFCGTPEDPQITYIQGQQPDSSIFPGLRIGSSLTELEGWARNQTEFTYSSADQWYDGPNGQYGWAFLSGNGYHYSFYIENKTICSFACWMEIS